MDLNHDVLSFLDELLLALSLSHAVHLDLPPLLWIHRRHRFRQPRRVSHCEGRAIIPDSSPMPGI